MAYTSGRVKGDDPRITKDYTSRTAEAFCQYLIPHLKPHYTILDVGCANGSITAGLAKYVPNGKVLGVDLCPEIIQTAKTQHADIANLDFAVGNAETLDDIPDASFDVVHSSWCLMHLSDPVRALKTWHRIVKPGGGIVACRDGKDFTIVAMQPDLPTVRKCWGLYEDWLKWRNSDPAPGLRKEQWAREAGLVDGEGKGKLMLTYSEDPHDRAIGPVYGEFLELLIKEGRTSLEEQEKVKEEWERWEKTPGHKFVTMASDMLYVKAQ